MPRPANRPLTEFDPAKLVAALRKAMEKVEALTKKVEFMEEQNDKRARMEDELGRHLTSLRTQMQERAGSFEAMVRAGSGADAEARPSVRGGVPRYAHP